MEVLTVPEVADVLRMGETTVRRLIRGGAIERVDTGGVRRYLVTREALDRFLAGNPTVDHDGAGVHDPTVGAVPHSSAAAPTGRGRR